VSASSGPASSSADGSAADRLEPRHQLLHPHPGAAEPAVEFVDDVGGPLQLLHQAVDVDHAHLELLDDGVELRPGVRVAEPSHGIRRPVGLLGLCVG
jgi:hypothetical protein